VAVVKPQVTVGPVMVVGVNGTLLTARVLAADVPQVLEAVTEILPDVNKLLLMLVVMVLVRELPEKPVGKVQLY
jgi:hypothetical protein